MQEQQQRPRKGSKTAVAVLIGVVVAALVAGGLVFVWQNGKIKDKDDALAAAQKQQASTQQQLDELTGKVSDLQGQLKKAQGQLRKTGHELNKEKEKQQQTQRQVEELTGPSLPDGRYVVDIKSIDMAAGPPKTTFDVMQWFTGKAADKAAKQDGAESPVPNDYYIRNESNQLRTFDVDPGAPVSIVCWHRTSVPDGKAITLAQLGAIFDGSANWQKCAQNSPYWLTVASDKITKIEAQYLP